MNTIKQQWTTLGVLACTLLTGASLQAQSVPTRVRLIASDPSALAGTSAGSFTLVRNETNDDLSVDVDLSGTAVNGTDYQTIANTLTIPAGFFAIDVPVQALVDAANRGNKTVTMSLQSNANYTIRGRGVATVKIVDDVFDLAPPSVDITSPADGAVITGPASVTITADISDPDVPVQSVSFYANDDLLGRDTTPPYKFTTGKLKAGTYAFFVRATDKFGKSSVSSVVNVTISATPVVTLSSPDNGVADFGSLVELDAAIGDSNESISSVTFFQGNTPIGTVTSAPFILNWPANSFGTFEFHAVATDAKTGKKGTSNTIEEDVLFAGGA